MQQHRAAEAIKDVERRLETAEKSRRERLQVCASLFKDRRIADLAVLVGRAAPAAEASRLGSV